MKKFSTLILALLLAACASACGVQPEGNAASSSEQEPGKVLMVYYSASGNTASVAQVIAAELGAETFEIVLAEPSLPSARRTEKRTAWKKLGGTADEEGPERSPLEALRSFFTP